MIEKVHLALEVLGAIATVVLPLLAHKHARLAAALRDVLDAVEGVGHEETQKAVEEVQK